MEFKAYLAEKIAGALREAFDASVDGIPGFLETPPNPEMGDFAFPCFRMS